jgi:hypothetical protein
VSRLNLHCELCGREQANGLLSGAAWGKVELSPDLILRACPNCRSTEPDWETQLRALQQGGTQR